MLWRRKMDRAFAGKIGLKERGSNGMAPSRYRWPRIGLGHGRENPLTSGTAFLSRFCSLIRTAHPFSIPIRPQQQCCFSLQTPKDVGCRRFGHDRTFDPLMSRNSACLTCRTRKVRCDRPPQVDGVAKCSTCIKLGRPCVNPGWNPEIIWPSDVTARSGQDIGFRSVDTTTRGVPLFTGKYTLDNACRISLASH